MTTPSQAAFEAFAADRFLRDGILLVGYERVLAEHGFQAGISHGRKQALEEAAAKFSGIDIHYTLTTGTITNVIKGLLK